ncbi:hypothetical protein CLV52_0364 [Amnibacterium kyonggiense]|uniref:Uncharacterized protein n=2 Tax=Amnibacterium kyonggiense TaxID=595671 RepID=A0A4R7FPY4_9MICO|nr:hypothetical protein CLV52_0364 [Amnibacterium kyonggiense]
MLKMTRRIGRLSGLIAAGVAIVGTGSGVMAASYSAFSSPTSVSANSWNTGSVHLTNDIGTAMFTGTNQQMNATGTKCVTVTSDGTLASTVRFYATGFSDSNSLGQHINLVVKMGSGSTNASTCSGFTAASTVYTGSLANLVTGGSAHTDYASGIVTTWAPQAASTTAETKQFQFTWNYDSTTPMSSTAAATFTWETQGS